MRIDILSLFPEYFKGPFDVSILRRAQEKNLLEIALTDIRSFSEDPRRRVDDRPFGGGPGMLLCPQPVLGAIRSVKKARSRVIYLSPQGVPLTQPHCRALAKEEHLILLCGHYEGVDERVMREVNEEISIGDYILTSGCAAAVVLVDAVSRLIPGVIGHPEATSQDSFSQGIFEGPQFTRPEVFEGMPVPPVLLQGNHAKIQDWRREQALKKTRRVRPELVPEEELEKEEK